MHRKIFNDKLSRIACKFTDDRLAKTTAANPENVCNDEYKLCSVVVGALNSEQTICVVLGSEK